MLADLSDLSDSHSHIRIPLRFDLITFWYIPTEAPPIIGGAKGYRLAFHS